MWVDVESRAGLVSGKTRDFITRRCVVDPAGWPRVIAADQEASSDTHVNRVIATTRENKPRGFDNRLGKAKVIEGWKQAQDTVVVRAETQRGVCAARFGEPFIIF